MIAKLTAFLALADAACYFEQSGQQRCACSKSKLERKAQSGTRLHKCPGNKLHFNCQLKCKKGDTSEYGSVNCEGEITLPTCQS